MAWADMTRIERLAHSIKNNTAWKDSKDFSDEEIAQANYLLSIDSSPSTSNDRDANWLDGFNEEYVDLFTNPLMQNELMESSLDQPSFSADMSEEEFITLAQQRMDEIQDFRDNAGAVSAEDFYRNSQGGGYYDTGSFLDTMDIETGAAEMVDELVQEIMASGFEIVRENGDVFNFGSPQLNRAMYGDNFPLNHTSDALSFVTPGYDDNDFLDKYGLAIALGGMSVLAAPAIATALGGGALGAAGTAAITNASTQLLTTGDLSIEDVLKSAATAGILEYLPNADSFTKSTQLGKIYAADNFLGAGVKSALNSVIEQAISDGEIDFGDAFKAGIIGSGSKMFTDFIKDSLAYNTPEQASSLFVDKNGNRLSQADLLGMSETEKLNAAVRASQNLGIGYGDAERLMQYALGESDYADLAGLLGPDGFLSKIGVNSDMVNINDFRDWVGSGLNQLPDWAKSGLRSILGESSGATWENMSESERAQALLGAYDERFFDVSTPRGDSELYGIVTPDTLAFAQSGASRVVAEAAASGTDLQFMLNAATDTSNPLYDTAIEFFEAVRAEESGEVYTPDLPTSGTVADDATDDSVSDLDDSVDDTVDDVVDVVDVVDDSVDEVAPFVPKDVNNGLTNLLADIQDQIQSQTDEVVNAVDDSVDDPASPKVIDNDITDLLGGIQGQIQTPLVVNEEVKDELPPPPPPPPPPKPTKKDNDQGLVFGHEGSPLPSTPPTEVVVNEEVKDEFPPPPPPPPPVSSPTPVVSGGGGSAGGGMMGGEFSPFLAGISYEVPAIAPLIQNPKVNYNAQLNALINRNVGLFEGII